MKMKAILEPSWGILGPFWDHFGPYCHWKLEQIFASKFLFTSWVRLGAILGRLGAILGLWAAVCQHRCRQL